MERVHRGKKRRRACVHVDPWAHTPFLVLTNYKIKLYKSSIWSQAGLSEQLVCVCVRGLF